MLRSGFNAILVLLLTLMTGGGSGTARAENIDPNNDGSQYCYGENVGWLNARPLGAGGPGVQVGDADLSGYLWAENAGWIGLSCQNTASCATLPFGVVNDGAGRLSGYAWSENLGWLNFAPTGGGVFIDGDGNFQGTAWGENIGWITFRSQGVVPFGIRTSWCPAVDIWPPISPATGIPTGWVNHDVSVLFSAVDNSCGVGVREIRYSLDAAAEVTTPGATATATITTEGSHTLSWFAIDKAGNAEAVRSNTIRIDKTPPTVTLTTPSDGAIYFINSIVPADYTASDAGSGIAGITGMVSAGGLVETSTPGSHTFTITATDAAGNATAVSHSYSVVVKAVNSSGIITTYAGSGASYGDGGPATSAQLNFPLGIALDGTGNLYFGDVFDRVIRRIDAVTGVITTIAGSQGVNGFSGDNGLATAAILSSSNYVALDPAGNVYIDDSTNSRIRKVNKATGIITTVAGGGSSVLIDGVSALTAKFVFPEGIAVNGAGNLYIADTNNAAVRKVDPAGIITTIAGSYFINAGFRIPNSGYSGDGGPATSAFLDFPQRVAVDPAGNVYLLDDNAADTPAWIVRRIDALTGIITTIAGGGASTGESGLATNADLGIFSNNTDIAVDGFGNLYIAGAYRVWKVVLATNAIRVIAGTGAVGFSGDGGDATLATFNHLGGVAVAGDGSIYLSDAGNSRIRKIASVVNSTIPDSFSFSQVTGAPLSSLIASNAITVSGISNPVAISISGGEYRINNGAWTTSAGTVNPGDTVDVRQTSSGIYATMTSATLTIGGVSGIFTVTTAPDITLTVTTPTNLVHQTISGTVKPGATVTVSLNGGPAQPATVVGVNWSFNVTGLHRGGNGIQVQASDSSGYAPTKNAAINCTAPQLTVTVTGTGDASGMGSGTVTSVPAAITCSGGPCSALFDGLSSVTLTPAPDGDSLFSGWSGVCSAPSGNCIVSMPADMNAGDINAGAVFAFVLPARIQGGGDYSHIRDAYAALTGTGVILARQFQFGSGLVLDRSITVFLKGGYNPSYTVNSGYSTIQGVLTVMNGSITLEQVIIK